MTPASPSQGLRSLDRPKYSAAQEGAARALGPETSTGPTATGIN